MDLKDRHKLLKKSKANVVYHGFRKRNNIITNEYCPIVGVTKKKPKDQIPDDEILPNEVDVVEIGPFKLNNHRDKHRPILGGISGHAQTGSYAGTLGLIVYDNINDNLVALTNNHCAGYLYDPSYDPISIGSTSTTGLKFSQPSPGDGGLSVDNIGTVVRAIPYKCGISAPSNLVDAALISIDDINLPWFSILNVTVDPVVFATNITESITNFLKSGRTSFITTSSTCDSTIVSVSENSVNVPLGNENVSTFFDDQIMIKSLKSEFLVSGDSGSVLVKDGDPNEILGLLFASTSNLPHYAMANRIDNVSSKLNISAWDGSIVVAQNSNKTITVGNRTFQRVGNTNRAITHSI